MSVCQLRARSVETPGQFGGAECTEPLMEERPCHSAKECRIEAVNCKDLFKCDSGTVDSLSLSLALSLASPSCLVLRRGTETSRQVNPESTGRQYARASVRGRRWAHRRLPPPPPGHAYGLKCQARCHCSFGCEHESTWIKMPLWAHCFEPIH